MDSSLRNGLKVNHMNQTDQIIGLDRPISAHRSLDKAWQRACDKHGEQYANDIFPGGKAVTDAGKAPRGFQAVMRIDEPGKWLLGGVKEHRSIVFDKATEAQAWLNQCLKTNQGLSSLSNVYIHSEIITFA